MIASLLLSILLLQTPPPGGPGRERPEQAQTPRPEDAQRAAAPQRPIPEEPPVVTKHEMKLGERSLKYTVTTGMMPIKNREGVTEASIFFMAYTLDGGPPSAQRPLMFSFNGGPGSASLWLHLGALGPKRVKMLEDGGMPPPPYQIVENDQTWLEQTDLVFIDPVGTGYSRAARPELGARFFTLNGDIESVGDFIRLYLTRYERWSSPLFLVGESYGTTRASGLAGHLINRGIALNGIVLVSTVMNFATLLFAPGNDLPYILILPSYTATAWFHKKLPPDLQNKPLRAVLDEAEKWVTHEYTVALGKGARLTPSERQAVVQKMARYTGLDAGYIENNDLRVELARFNKELLRSENRTTGRLDSRFKGIDSSAASERPDFDPSMSAIRAPFTAAFNSYVRSELNFKSDLEYYALGGGVGQWNFNVSNGYADTSTALRSAFSQNPYLKLFVASGYYDMATPYFAADYTLDHMGLEPTQRKNVRTAYYEAGHMMYIDVKSLALLKRDVVSFIQASVGSRTSP
ncbi:MAG: peptidase S10 [Acidobacteriota bacterium]